MSRRAMYETYMLVSFIVLFMTNYYGPVVASCNKDITIAEVTDTVLVVMFNINIHDLWLSMK